jgi:hypothetical protein
MSVEAMKWAFKQELDYEQKIVLLALAQACDSHGRCCLAKKDISQITGLSTRSIVYILRFLSYEVNLISLPRLHGPDGRSISNLYQLHVL